MRPCMVVGTKRDEIQFGISPKWLQSVDGGLLDSTLRRMIDSASRRRAARAIARIRRRRDQARNVLDGS